MAILSNEITIKPINTCRKMLYRFLRLEVLVAPFVLRIFSFNAKNLIFLAQIYGKFCIFATDFARAYVRWCKINTITH